MGQVGSQQEVIHLRWQYCAQMWRHAIILMPGQKKNPKAQRPSGVGPFCGQGYRPRVKEALITVVRPPFVNDVVAILWPNYVSAGWSVKHRYRVLLPNHANSNGSHPEPPANCLPRYARKTEHTI